MSSGNAPEIGPRPLDVGPQQNPYAAGAEMRRLGMAMWSSAVIQAAGELRLADAIGHWLAVAFLPADVGLAAGPAAERRRFLDRLLALSDQRYYTALARYRAALAQRNAALRTDRPDLARAFDRVLAESGAVVMASRLRWAERAGEGFAAELDGLGESETVCLRYHGRAELADSAAWPAALEAAAGRDQARRASTVGPHRDGAVLGRQHLLH